MPTRVRSNLFSLLQQIELANHRKYSWSHIGQRIGISRQATKTMFLSEQTDDSYIKYGAMGRLLDFFRSEGLDITISDLFVVTDSAS